MQLFIKVLTVYELWFSPLFFYWKSEIIQSAFILANYLTVINLFFLSSKVLHLRKGHLQALSQSYSISIWPCSLWEITYLTAQSKGYKSDDSDCSRSPLTCANFRYCKVCFTSSAHWWTFLHCTEWLQSTVGTAEIYQIEDGHTVVLSLETPLLDSLGFGIILPSIKKKVMPQVKREGISCHTIWGKVVMLGLSLYKSILRNPSYCCVSQISITGAI